MKFLFAVFSFFFINPSPEPMLVIDKDLKKPATISQTFTAEQYLQRTFPIYAPDIPSVVDATDKAVKWIDREQTCNSATKITAAHTSILIEVSCGDFRKVTVTLITQMDESHASYSFPLIRNEEDLRKAQRRLLDFATYIEQ